MGAQGFVDAGEDIIFYLDTGDIPYMPNKPLVDSLFFRNIESILGPLVNYDIDIDFSGMYLDGKVLLLAQNGAICNQTPYLSQSRPEGPFEIESDYGLLCNNPSYLVSPKEHKDMDSDELEYIILESAKETNKELIVSVESKSVKRFQWWVFEDIANLTQKDIDKEVERFYELYNTIHDQRKQNY